MNSDRSQATISTAALPQINTSLPGPEARRVLELDRTYVSPSYTRDYPLVAKRGQGLMVEDMDGNTFLDFAAGIAVCSTGHCHPEVVRAIQEQAATLIHMSGTDFYYPGMPQLAERLARVAPGKEAKRVYFGNSGAEAVEAAIKLAKYHTKRDKLVAFHGAFHGRTMGALSLTASRAVQRKGFGTLLSGVFHMPFPDTYRGTYGVRPECASADCLSYLENELFRRRVDPDEVAAIFIEPIQGEGGYLVAPAEFLQGLDRICRKYGILLVADEVQCGMGRTGKWWAVEHSGVEPDIICSAKGIASGMPLGAVIARASVMDWTPGAHASTFGGNPVCIAAALATMDLLEQEYIANAARMGEFIFNRLADWRERHKIVGDVRGKGLMIGIEIVRNQRTKEKAPDLRNRLVQMAFHKGLLVLGSGDTTLRLMPPLMVHEEQTDFALNTLDACLTEIEREM
ncbi:MAG TPA: acetyl ornithine aminotransferase family protein [Terriglobia bacterium]|jgi:4-aminobutyrate aminotransferase|nr:acetyl ornithine aminotransferase family protein [Terriglobia bacterium]